MAEKKDQDTLSGLRRRVVGLELEVNRLRSKLPAVYCRECKHRMRSAEGVFLRCRLNNNRIVSPEGYCSEGSKACT